MPRVEITSEGAVTLNSDPAATHLALVAPTALVPLSVLEAEAERQQAAVHAKRLAEVGSSVPSTPIKLDPSRMANQRRGDRERAREREIHEVAAEFAAKRPIVYQGVRGGPLLSGYVK